MFSRALKVAAAFLPLLVYAEFSTADGVINGDFEARPPDGWECSGDCTGGYPAVVDVGGNPNSYLRIPGAGHCIIEDNIHNIYWVKQTVYMSWQPDYYLTVQFDARNTIGMAMVTFKDVSRSIPYTVDWSTWCLSVSHTGGRDEVGLQFAICDGWGEHLHLDNVLVFASSIDLTTLHDTVTFCVDGELCVEHPYNLSVVLLGDMDCDGDVDFDDINPFVLAITDPLAYQTAYPCCNFLDGDCNGDGFVDFDDINPFVVLLAGG
jgi:hypothetical protein